MILRKRKLQISTKYNSPYCIFLFPAKETQTQEKKAILPKGCEHKE
jgi:hypothetical protein